MAGVRAALAARAACTHASVLTPCLMFAELWFTSALRTRRCRNLSGASEAGLRLQLCSGCNIARYCSPACHKAAWRADHKGACRRLQARA